MEFIKYTVKNSEELIYKTLLYLTFYSSSVILYLTFDISLSPDFEKYYKYFEYYSSTNSFTNLEQGNFYFFIVYLFSCMFKYFLNFLSISEIVNISVHFANNLIFIVGIIGFKNLLKIKKYTISHIYLSLITLCFFPAGIQLRLSLKPELISFSFIVWLLYFFEKYLEDKNDKYIYISTLILSLIVTSKISIALMVIIFLTLEIFNKHRYLFDKKNTKYLLFLVVLTTSLLMENRVHNGKFINEVDHDIKYDNVAELSFFTNIETQHLINNPNKYFHNKSFVSITLFDTFNDFFEIYWNSEYTELNKDRNTEIFKIKKIPNNQGFIKVKFDKVEKTFTFSGDFDSRWDDTNYINETRMRIAFIFSIVFYSLCFLFSFKKQNRVLLSSHLIGLIIIAISALGLFGTNNFDPNVGDSAKTFYFSFLLIISFVFLMLEVFKFLNFGTKTISFIIVLFFMFFIGFPHSYSEKPSLDIAYKNSILPTCAINKPIIENLLLIREELNCDTEELNHTFISLSKWREVNFKLSLEKIPYINIFIFIIILILGNKKTSNFIYKKYNLFPNGVTHE